MPELFKNKYRIDSIRLKEYDYGSNGIYFITICTKNRVYYFGDVIDGEMVLNDYGKYTEEFWLEIPKHFPFVLLDEFQIMPNHMHGIVVINKNNDYNYYNNIVETLQCNVVDMSQSDVETLHCNVSTTGRGIINPKRKHFYSSISPKPESLPTILRSYKSICTKTINRLPEINFSWQSNYYERIIHDEKGLNRAREYIRNNPINWEFDRNNLKNKKSPEKISKDF